MKEQKKYKVLKRNFPESQSGRLGQKLRRAEQHLPPGSGLPMIYSSCRLALLQDSGSDTLCVKFNKFHHFAPNAIKRLK